MRNAVARWSWAGGMATVVAVVCLCLAQAAQAPSGEPNPPPPPTSAPKPHAGLPDDPSLRSMLSIVALSVGKGRTIYAGTFGMGIYRSEDRGASWTAANAGLADKFIMCLTTASDGTVYAGTLRGGVFRSRDEGKTWQAINDGLTRMQVKAVMIAGNDVYIGTGGGVYRMTVGKDRWTEVTIGLEEILVHAVVMDSDSTLYAGTSGKGVMRWNAKAAKAAMGWAPVTGGLTDHEGLRENFVRVLAIDKYDTLFAGTFDGGVYRSRDSGRTWRPISRALPNDSIRGIVMNERSLFVGTGRGVFKSFDEGRRWMPINGGLTEMAIQVLALSQDGVLYAGTSAGAFRTDDEGNSWINISQGLQATEGFAVPFQ